MNRTSVLIKGMKMPTCCSKCEFHESGSPDWCNLSVCDYREIDNSKIIQEWCPLVEVPTRHGDLCDLISRRAAIDALWKALFEYEDKTEKQFQESEDLDVGDWMLHRIFVQNMNGIDIQALLDLPSLCAPKLP